MLMLMSALLNYKKVKKMQSGTPVLKKKHFLSLVLSKSKYHSCRLQPAFTLFLFLIWPEGKFAVQTTCHDCCQNKYSIKL